MPDEKKAIAEGSGGQPADTKDDKVPAADSKEKTVVDTAPDDDKIIADIKKKMTAGEAKDNKLVDEPDDKSADDGDDKSGDADDDDVDSDDDDLDDDGDDGDDDPVVDDDLLERAVKAGMKMADAKAVSDPAVLTRIVSGMEAARSAASAKDSKSADDKPKDDTDDLASRIPDLKEEDGYDKDIVDLISGIKGVIRDQQKVIGDLRSQVAEGSKGSELLWLDKKLSESKDLPDEAKGDAGRSKIGRYVKLFQADAKEAGESMTQDQAFDLAINAAYGKEIITQKRHRASLSAKKRAQQTISQPRDSDNGQFTPADSDDHDAVALKLIRGKMAKLEA